MSKRTVYTCDNCGHSVDPATLEYLNVGNGVRWLNVSPHIIEPTNSFSMPLVQTPVLAGDFCSLKCLKEKTDERIKFYEDAENKEQAKARMRDVSAY